MNLDILLVRVMLHGGFNPSKNLDPILLQADIRARTQGLNPYLRTLGPYLGLGYRSLCGLRFSVYPDK